MAVDAFSELATRLRRSRTQLPWQIVCLPRRDNQGICPSSPQFRYGGDLETVSWQFSMATAVVHTGSSPVIHALSKVAKNLFFSSHHANKIAFVS